MRERERERERDFPALKGEQRQRERARSQGNLIKKMELTSFLPSFDPFIFAERERTEALLRLGQELKKERRGKRISLSLSLDDNVIKRNHALVKRSWDEGELY